MQIALNRDFIARLNNSDLELKVIYGIIQLVGGLDLLQTMDLVKLKSNRKMTKMDIWFANETGELHRCIDL
jgi:hypothetical protein